MLNRLNKYKPYIYLALLIPFSLVGLYILYNNAPMESSIYPSCPSFVLTGLHCPGCGTARALHSMVHFDFIKAIDFNPLTVFFTPIIAYSILSYFVKEFTGKKLLKPFNSARSMLIVLVVVILFTVLRNIPLYPFTILAP